MLKIGTASLGNLIRGLIERKLWVWPVASIVLLFLVTKFLSVAF